MRLILTLLLLLLPVSSRAQDTLTIATVNRAPFAMIEGEKITGFSVDLWQMVAEQLALEFEFRTVDTFAQMLELVSSGAVDGAIANISVTAEREAQMDFTQPIFDSGLQIMVPFEESSSSVIAVLVTRDIAYAMLAAAALLFGGGMLMWVFERGRSEYFNRPARDAMFPAFWWALNLVVNGGFEERMPNSRPGRFFAVLLVIGSLFFVSIFVAKITAAMTVDALQNSIDSLADLEGKRIGTVEGSTASVFLRSRDLQYIGLQDLDELFNLFGEGALDAVVFDKPILAYYAANKGRGEARLLDRTFKPENYAMALPTGSPLREQIDQSLLKIREDGSYDSLRAKWFGSAR
ncbi:transporter substrate-binding domain-containing protein [Litoreibacter janthinus]|uniref:Amino acid ABC transporter substrate-binding protein, PAAT family n=1 Tax=Litoreibacter janthinus TaxID=670154 RepID=A0A1I6FX71_9RHOB|nr:transporter substrate-binding domain-containing protein [Litoreibacter janthinus]SFR34562.1 amino acid ABC transporter substrate-binding protein, PAAT family [Litoreibacter janthinus]